MPALFDTLFDQGTKQKGDMLFSMETLSFSPAGVGGGIHPSMCSNAAFHFLSRKECHNVYLEANGLGSLSGIMMMFIRNPNTLVPSHH